MIISKSNILRLFGIIILVYILYKVNWDQLGKSIAKTDPVLLSIAFILNIPTIWVKSFRWKTLLHWQKHYITNKKAFFYYLCGSYLSFITPGRLGDLSKAFYLKQGGITNLSKGFSSVIADRLHDICLLLLLGLICLIIYVPHSSAQIIGWIGITLTILIPFIFVFFRQIQSFIGSFFNRFIIRKIPFLSKENAWDFQNSFRELITWKLWQTSMLTIISYAIFFLQCYFISLSIKIPVSYWEIILIMSFTNFISFLPVSIAGIGTREAALLYLLIPKGIGYETIICFSMGVFLIFYVGGGFLGAIVWSVYPLKLKFKKQETK
ncbi:MAG: lysylphosphatidylglycerol synthase transmembrane domain-containing protein [Bacteroidota bacterium]